VEGNAVVPNPPAVPGSLTDPLLEEQQASTYMALQDAETYMGWLAEKIKDPKLEQARDLIREAHRFVQGG
jgi:hypothetical protein